MGGASNQESGGRVNTEILSIGLVEYQRGPVEARTTSGKSDDISASIRSKAEA